MASTDRIKTRCWRDDQGRTWVISDIPPISYCCPDTSSYMTVIGRKKAPKEMDQRTHLRTHLALILATRTVGSGWSPAPTCGAALDGLWDDHSARGRGGAGGGRG